MAGFTAPSMAHMTVLLALAMAVLVTPPAAAQLLVSSSDLHLAATRTSPGIVEQTLSSLSLLSPSSLQLSQPLVPVLAIPQCGMMSQIQIGDTCASITATFNLSSTDFLALNPGLDCSTFTPLTSVCIGDVNKTCNKPLDTSGQCPDWLSTHSLVPPTVGNITLSLSLRMAFTEYPDLYTILNDVATNITFVPLGQVDALIMEVPATSSAVSAVYGNPGHPFISLWKAGIQKDPLVIAIVPGWFTTGGIITFIPGGFLQQSIQPVVSRKLLMMARGQSRNLLQGRGPSYPGATYYQSNSYYG